MTADISEILAKNEADMHNLAKKIAQNAKAGDIFALYGALGAGKTSFCRHFIQSLTSPEENVPSPTFTLIQQYETSKGILYHLDLYRLEDPEEIFNIGWDDIMEGGIMLIEWPQRLAHYLPQKRSDIFIDILPDETRKIQVKTYT